MIKQGVTFCVYEKVSMGIYPDYHGRGGSGVG
jgi:hypothetical protein